MVKPVCPACQDLVYIGLMSHIPYYLVAGTVEYPVDAKCDLHDTKIRGQMSPGMGDFVHQKIPDGIR
jgi:hypothetical protein